MLRYRLLHLVVVHEHPDAADGGAADFDFTGLGSAGWTAQDDPSDTYPSSSAARWAWASAHTDGGAVGPHPDGLNEIGYADIAPTQAGRQLIPGPMRVFHWHTEGVETPPGGERLAEGEVFPNQAFRLGEHAYGLQFHPETTVEIFSTWIQEAGHMLDWPGAQPKEAIFADAKRHDPPLAQWLDGFMQRWIGRE